MILLISCCKHVSNSGQFCPADHKLCSSYFRSMFFNLILWRKEALICTLLSLYFQWMPKPFLAADQAWQSNACDQADSFCGVLLPILKNTIHGRISIKTKKLNTYIEKLANLVILIYIKNCAREVYSLNPRKLLFGFPDFLIISQQFTLSKQFHKDHKLQTCYMPQKFTHLTNLRFSAHIL